VKIKCTVGRIEALTAKPTDPECPCPIVWSVTLRTHPHIGDIELRGEDKIFTSWASSLHAGQVVTLEALP
jgi:hypothetical protein